jgi:PAS domain S-box-containing protein
MEQDTVRELLRTLPGVVYRCTYDSQWTMLFISDEIEAVTGFPASGFMDNRDRTFASVIHPDDRDRVEREIDAQIEHQHDFACEYRIVRADGGTVWILERGRRVVRAGQPTAMLDGLLFDITERKRAQHELQASVAEQASHQAVAEERSSVARELHDSVGHALGVVSLYAGIAATQLRHHPDVAAVTVQTIRDVVREALDDIDRLLGAVGDVSDGPVANGLSDVGLLATRVRAAGIPVELAVEGDPGAYPTELDHAAYRVVQEGLTNAMKHARDASVIVRVEHGRGTVTIKVINEGSSEQAPLAAPGGRGAIMRTPRGISGLKDRIHGLGGELIAGARPEGGFAVTATIPFASTSVAGEGQAARDAPSPSRPAA